MSEHKIKEQKNSVNQISEIFTSLLSDPNFKLPKKIVWALFGITVLSVYFSTLFNGFVWDDVASIQESPILHSYSYLPKIFGEVMNLIYRPLTYSSFIVIYQTFGGAPFFFHLLSITAHFVSCVLIFYILRNYFKDKLAVILALLFAVHPMNIEAISWASAYSEVSYVLYGLASFLFARKYAERNTNIHLIFMSVFIFLSYLSKESAFVISAIILLFFILFQRKKLIPVMAFQIIPLLIYLSLRFVILKSSILEILDKSIVPIQSISTGERLLQIPAIILYYYKTFFIPFPLKTQQNWIVQFDFSGFFLPLIVVLAICSGLLLTGMWIKRNYQSYFKVYLFFSGWIVIWTLFHIQLLPLTMTVAERWGYLGLIGVLGLVGIIGKIVLNKKLTNTRILLGLCVVVFFIFAGITITRNGDWRNNYKLYSADYRLEDRNAFLENGLGAELLNKELYDDAYPYLERSVRLSPKGWKNWTNLGIYYQKKGQYDKAEQSYRTAINNYSGFMAPYERLSFMLFRQDRLDDAEKVVIAGLKINFKNLELIKTYSLILYTKGEKEKAIELMKSVILNDPTEQNKSLLQDMQDNLNSD